ncbi:NYN domain-containing protein [Candidatus Uhrbacteria bacterium]|nr:NYN domain-containing protein [Candidatus Uhrbacteria bacterium]
MISFDQRVAVLIDTQNMYHSAKHIHGARLAFEKAVDAIVGGRQVVRVFAYVARSKTGEEQAFFDALTSAGIELRVKDVQEFSSGEKKADWDVGMAVDAVRLAEKVDAIVLMTGDGDFVPLVQYLQGKGVLVEVAAFAESTNAQLKTVTDRFYDLSTEGHEFLINPKRRAAASGKDKLSLSLDDDEKHEKGPGEKLRRVKVTF